MNVGGMGGPAAAAAVPQGARRHMGVPGGVRPPVGMTGGPGGYPAAPCATASSPAMASGQMMHHAAGLPAADVGALPAMAHATQSVPSLAQQAGDLRTQVQGSADGSEGDGVAARLGQLQDALQEVQKAVASARTDFEEELAKAARTYDEKLERLRAEHAQELKALKDRVEALEVAKAGSGSTPNGVATAVASRVGAASLPVLPPPLEMPAFATGKRPLPGGAAESDAKAPRLPLESWGAAPTKVVNAKVTRLRAPELQPLAGLSIDEVYTAFCSVGAIEKIVCFPSPMQGPPFEHIDSMVQFATPELAQKAIKCCNGLCLSNDGYNRTEVTQSIQSDLLVFADAPQCRDYTRGRPAAVAAAQVATPSGGAVPTATSVPPPQQQHQQVSAVVPPPASSVSTRNEAPAPAAAAAGAKANVVSVQITELHLPNTAPLGGLTADMVGTAFKQFGTVEKIVMGPEQAALPLQKLDALVQFSDADSARRAMTSAQGQSLTGDGFHNMRVELASLTQLVVTGNTQTCWDYTASGTTAT